MRNRMHFGTVALLGLALAVQAIASDSPYLTDNEESALCAYQVAQNDYFRDHGEYAEVPVLLAGDQPYLDPAWPEQLGRYEIDRIEVFGAEIYYYGFYAWLEARPGTDAAPFLQFGSFGFGRWAALTQEVNGERLASGELLDCADRGIYPARSELRVMDDLLSVADALAMYWRTHGALPPALDDQELIYSSYLPFFPVNGREGYTYAYATDGTDFSIAAWPNSPRTAGQRAFYCDQTGVLRASPGPGAGPDSAPVTAGLPQHLVTVGAGVENERTIPALLCAIYEAQEAYFLANGRYTTSFSAIQGTEPPYLNRNMDYSQFSYNYILGNDLSGYSCRVDAIEYGIGGFRTFFLDASGVVRADIDFNADITSPVLGQVCEIDESFQPRGVSLPGPARADSNGDYRVGLSELLALIQFFNVGQYHCREGAEAYAAGPGAQDCAALEFDADTSWSLDLPELLRGIQIFNGGAYFPCPGGEDGLCIPASPVF